MTESTIGADVQQSAGARLAPSAGADLTQSTGAAPTRQAIPGTADNPVPLWRNVRFQTLWAGSAAAGLGIAVADVAYPLAILAVTGSPARAGLFAAAQTIGMIIAGLPAGQLADRRSPRAILILSAAVRTVITLVIAAVLMLGWLTLPVLLIAAVILGAAQPAASAAQILLVRAVVPPEQLTAALTQDEVRINGADLAGPPIGGALYGIGALAHAVPFLFSAGSFLLSLVSALLVKVAPRGAEAEAELTSGSGRSQDRHGMLAGVRTIWRSPLLRATTLLIATVNSVGVSLNLVAVVILRDQSVPPQLIGLALAGGAVGGLAGAPLVRPLHKLRPGILLIVVCALEVPLMALLAVPYGPWWMAAVLFTAMLGVPSIRVLLDVLILRQTPQSERGRIIGAVMTLLSIGMPAGLAVSGLLLQFLSAQATMLILAGVMAFGVLYCAARPALWSARWPR